MTDLDLTHPAARTRPRWATTAVAALSGTAVIAAAAVLQFWFAPFVVGLAIGGYTRLRHRRAPGAVLGVTVATVGGWTVPLVWRVWSGEPVVAAARVTAALAGLPASGSLLLAVTLLVALLQGLLGVWLGRAVCGLRGSTG